MPIDSWVGPGLGANDPSKMSASKRIHAEEYSPLYVHNQCLCPQSEPCPTPASPGDLARLAGSCGPSSYEITAFVFVPGACEFFICPLRVKSLFPLSCGALAVRPASLQSQMLWGLLFPVPDPLAGGLDIGFRTLSSVEEPL